jgi:uncharacterized protein with ParB-like and HNH nuclease domain
MSARVQSEVQTPAKLCRDRTALVIPSYQRPYVWPSDDVVGLLNQIIDAYLSGEPHYYIGTLLTSHSATHTHSDAVITYELIDGQQRMTTLMVLALAFIEVSPSTPLKALTVLGAAPRLTFNIREEVQAQLSAWAGLQPGTEKDEALKPNPYLTHLRAAKKSAADRLQKLLKEQGEEMLSAVGSFIFERVKWVNNIMPAGMDLNRLFATLNTSGLQLEQTDILKARLMDKIVQNKACYEGIWQACEDMNDYFERNLRGVFKDAKWGQLKFTELSAYSRDNFFIGRPAGGRDVGRSISEIAAQRLTEDEHSPEQKDDNQERYQSIVSFGLLLMHAFRIYRHQRQTGDIDERLNDSRLNKSFEEFVKHADAAQAKEFLECLWQVRYQFDRWVVKWVRLGEEDTRLLRVASVVRQSKGPWRYDRTFADTASNLSQLQSVRYFTGERSAQYWLTPFLGALVEQPELSEKQVLALLEGIDNQLSLTSHPVTQKVASYLLLSSVNAYPMPVSVKLDYLREALGTGFEHYWFQKLEYILWREKLQLACFNGDKVLSYRIASKNSVEHVHPQNEEFMNELPESLLHSFGNLVLLSPGENSSYSNLAVIKKQASFRAKPHFDSLKLAHMFHVLGRGDDWGESQIRVHENEMLGLIAAHYEK